MRTRCAMRSLAALSMALALTACGGGSGGGGPDQGGTIPGCAGGTGTFRVISGTVRFQRLRLKTTGLGPELDLLPARHVDVEVRIQADGSCLGRTSTDASGAYSVAVAPEDGTVMQVVVFSRTAFDPTRDYTVHNADPPVSNTHDPNNAYSFTINDVPGTGSQVVDIDVPYIFGGARPSIGFGTLDIVVTCIDQVAAAVTPTAVAPVHIYTRLGNNTTLNGASFYRPGANAIALLAGAAGQEDSTDTDYFDDAVVAHELGHYVENTLSHSLSRGGRHSGEPLEPNFAFSEGHATGFGNLLLGTPLYIDSRTTNDDLFFSVSVENVTGPADPPGIGGEFTVAEIIWDLGDGGAGPADGDADGVNTSLASLYASLTTFNPDVDAPYIGLFLDRLDNAPGNTVNAAQLTGLMLAPENQGITYPVPANEVFPTPIAIGGAAETGTCDSLPGSNKNMCRGITTTRWYRLSIPAQTTVTVALTITPIAGSGDNLNLFVFSNRDIVNPLSSSTNGGATGEQIVTSLGLGEYLICVEAAYASANCVTGTGNRADFSLTVN